MHNLKTETLKSDKYDFRSLDDPQTMSEKFEFKLADKPLDDDKIIDTFRNIWENSIKTNHPYYAN